MTGTFSDGEGRFELWLRPGARVDLRITGETSGRFPRPVEEVEGLRGELLGVTAPAEGITVKARRIAFDRWMVVEVLGPDGRPVAGASLQASWGSARPHSRRDAETDEDGQARIDNLPPEPVTVVLVEDPRPIATVPEGQILQLRLDEAPQAGTRE